MLNDGIVTMCVNSDICIMGEAEVHDIVEDAMHIRAAGNTMNDMIRLHIIQPLTIVYL